jgi:hypothetical protein
VRRPLALLGGALGGAALLKLVARRRPRPLPAPVDAGDSRADELRRRLAESRALADERDEFEGAETTVDAAEADDPDARRRAVHEAGRATAEQMREAAGGDSP